MTHDLTHYYQHVQETGKLRTPDHARRWSTAVLKTLGTVLDRGSKKSLARALPQELADDLTAVFWLLHFRDMTMSQAEFQRRVAMRSGNTNGEFAHYPIKAVFAGIQEMIDRDLQQKVAGSLATTNLRRQSPVPCSQPTGARIPLP